ncbi:helix-turn-helix domain-containing protein [candidate division KSB3 bacterium]|uniref:Helix-turn-helix domain-containing protein n=1 Tax=candidate division KSB3 bacterium TaxID=2044937 RepID=A0A9D5JV33_9BACT|nr:helix-turn-helix domain-containing protein [candidate division KSB3 bacterium]MBD3324456.1 helix-turn-helix domain-containing protein [candidate division KSB3 bacterium]
MKKKRAETLKSVEKALQILETFSMRRPELSVVELEEMLPLPKVSIYRFLRILRKRGFISRNPHTRKYRLGIKVFELGSIVLRNMELRKAAFPLIENLSKRSGETVHLGVLDGKEAVSIEGAESGYSLRISLPIGKRVYLHSTGIGKAILAFLDEEDVEEVLEEKGLPRFTEQTITDPKVLMAELQLIRERGYAVDNEENEPGVRCVAAPILDSSQQVMASVSISGPSVRITDAKIPSLAKMVIETSHTISRALGYRV